MNSADIKNLRWKMNLTQEQLANLVGVSFVTLNRWENCVSNPSPLAMKKLIELQKKLQDKS
jgi:putative transcriptional regulator